MISKNVILLICVFLSLHSHAQREKLGKAIGEQLKSDQQAQEGQKQVDQIDAKTQELLDEYRIVLRKIENTQIYNEQLEKLIVSQEEEKVSIAEQIDSVNVTNQEIVPLMISMVQTFSDFIEADIPFLAEERARRAKSLEKMMNRADVSTSEKFRRIMEAYQVENEYGRTIEAYRDKITDSKGQSKTVDILRIGRLSLLYQSLDGKEQGLWDETQKQWVALGRSARKKIRDALRVARKQAAPDMLMIPLLISEKE